MQAHYLNQSPNTTNPTEMSPEVAQAFGRMSLFLKDISLITGHLANLTASPPHESRSTSGQENFPDESSTSNESIVSETLSAAFSKSATSLDAKTMPKGFDHPAKELQSAVTETTSTFVSHSGSGIEPTTCYPVPSPSADQPSVSKDHTPAHTESPSANPVTHSEPRIEPKSSFLKSSRSASTPSALTDTTKTDSISLAGCNTSVDNREVFSTHLPYPGTPTTKPSTILPVRLDETKDSKSRTPTSSPRSTCEKPQPATSTSPDQLRKHGSTCLSGFNAFSNGLDVSTIGIPDSLTTYPRSVLPARQAEPHPTPSTTPHQLRPSRPDLMKWIKHKEARYRILQYLESGKLIFLSMEYDGLHHHTFTRDLETELDTMLIELKRQAKILPPTQRDGEAYLVARDFINKTYTAAIFYDNRVVTCHRNCPVQARQQMPAHHHLDSPSLFPDPTAMSSEVAQAFGRMSLFMKDISLITGHLANVMAFTPQESRSTSGQEDPPDESVASMDYHSVVQETPSAASDSPKAYHHTYSQCSNHSSAVANQMPAFTETRSAPRKSVINHEGIASKAYNPASSQSAPFAFGIHKPALAETPSSPSKLVINHEELHIDLLLSRLNFRSQPILKHPRPRPNLSSIVKASSQMLSLPDFSQPAPFTLATKKPIVPETPPAACKSGINHEELNIESKASLLKSSQSASSASAPNKTTTSKSTCPEDLIATLDGLKVPSTSPAFSAFLTRKSQSTFTTKNTKANEPKPTALTSKIQSQTPKPDLMVWTVYKDARYRITYQGQETKSIWLDMEFDGIRTCTTAYELESALVTMLEGLKKHATMLPKFQRDGQPHLVSRDLSDKSHTAAIYYDGRVITSTGRSMSKAIERVKEMKQGSMPAHHHLDSPSHSPAMPPEVAQAFGRMSIFMQDISLITGHLANVMAFTPHESRSSSTSGQEDPPDESVASMDYHSVVEETPSPVPNSAIYPEPRTEPKDYHTTYPQSPNKSSALANQKPTPTETLSTSSKFVINHEGIESKGKASLPEFSQATSFAFGIQKPTLTKTPLTPSKFVINHEELNIKSMASDTGSSQSAPFAFGIQKPASAKTPSSPSKLVINHEELNIDSKASHPESAQSVTFTFEFQKPASTKTPSTPSKLVINHEELNIEPKASLTESSQSASSASAPNETTASESTCPEDLIATLDGLKVPSTSPAFSAFLTKKSQSTFTTKNTTPNEPKPTPPTPKIQSQTPRPDLMVWTVYKDARYRITYLGQETKSIWLDMEFDGIRTCTIAFELESALVMMLEGLKKHAKMLPKSQRDGQPHLVSSNLSDKSHTAAIYYDGRVITSTGRSMSEAIESVKEMKQRTPSSRLTLPFPCNASEVAQAFGRMSIFMKDISLITGHLANVMTFPPQESRLTSAQGNAPDEPLIASKDHHTTVKETLSAASDSATYPEPRSEPKTFHPAHPQSSNHSSAFANQKPALAETPSSPSKLAINNEGIESKASLPDSSQPAPLMFGTKKPIVPEAPSAACKSGINHEELNIESKASLLKSSQSASSASATKETTASESICPEKLIAIVDGLKLPSTSPVNSFNQNTNPIKPKPTSPTAKVQSQTLRPDTMVWTVYKDARYRITYQNDKVVWINMEFDGLRRSLVTRELRSALVITLEELKRQAKMLPKSQRDGEPHLVCRDLSDETHAAAIYYDGRVITYSGRSTSEALEKVKEKKQSSIEFGRRCGYAFGRMSLFLKDISLITGHLANVMAFPPQESRSTSGQEDPPDESSASKDHQYTTFNEAPSAAYNSATYREPRSEPKACHPTYSQSSSNLLPSRIRSQPLSKHPRPRPNLSSIMKASSQMLPFPTLQSLPLSPWTKKPIVPETPPAACKFGIKHEELNIESKASHPESSHQRLQPKITNQMNPSLQLRPRRSNRQTPKPDLMVWTVYKDARYMITYQGPDDKSIWLNMEFDDLKTCTIAYELESALVMMLEELKTQAKMLPKSKRDGEAHLVCSDLSDETHAAAIYHDGRVITYSGRSTSEALEKFKEKKESSIEFGRRCGYVAKP
ncbi:hypothetical protein PSTT_03949 [Puccinia striiformis]|uniref:Uncharacterized protein n=1 Tax=Puccinia striiformis TaxID=27350 RepID=A0A2S4VUS6_9BASI|nr:hypothetical protein PSTT_03949 [Puccinia striiformis]